MNQWSESPFTCYKDMNSCLILSFFPLASCIFQSAVVTRSTGESFITAFLSSLLFLSIGSAINRGKIRDQYLIKGSFLTDFLIHSFCTICAISQEYRELLHRDLSLP